MTLANWLGRWEQDFWRCVLTPQEQQDGYFLHHNANALLRGDFKTRMEGYASSLQNGFLNIDEVRELEDRNPLPNGAGKKHHIQTNMGTIAANGQVQPPAPLVTLDTGDDTDSDE
jgi:phage portal protein BeeE